MEPPPLPSSTPPLPFSAPKRKPSFLRRLGCALALLVAMSFALFFGMIGYHIIKAPPRIKDPGEVELTHAIMLITSGDEAASGNFPLALTLAGKLSERIKDLHDKLFTGGNDRSIDMQVFTKGKFLVYCRLNEEDCVFLIRVPDLRQHTGSAKQSLIELAYVAACSTLAEHNVTKVHKVVVATHGMLLFNKVVEGAYPPDLESLPSSLREVSGTAMVVPQLFPYFSPPLVPPLVTPSASIAP